ncbi:putative YigZ family protein [Mumia flava]|uniref:Putative YigZ family protein n=1 Tax=Mumia flava TaxID=1348852 RepID=A0A0B2BC79_9ACTN|nr:YigZ family protein [Mumia flava]PJJ57579.1 putative YigZ family protein [Mumia flava]
MIDAYLVPGSVGESVVEDRGSRFVGRVRRVETEDEARAVIAAARAQHPDARHHCTAFVLGPEGALRRSNDDGEPGGTAGAPMLDVLDKRGVRDVVAVVTRWFGGTLLGAGGLVRAYGEATSRALDDAGVLRRERQVLVRVRVGHADAGRLEHELRSGGVAVRGVTYGADASFEVAVAPGRVDALDAQVAALTAGTAALEVGDEVWAP